MSNHQRPLHIPSWQARWNQNREAIIFSLKRLWQHPSSTWITLAAIAIALSLPTGLHLLLKNLQTLTDDKREIPTITLFLTADSTLQEAKDRAILLSEQAEIDSVLVVPREDALNDFRQITGFAEILSTLDENPLPNVLVVTPKLDLLGDVKRDMQKLAKKLEKFPEIEVVQVDLEWVQRLKSIINIADRVIMVVSVLLGMTVLLVVGNTIRLDIQNRKQEIEVSRYIGATKAYIRHPFLYGGLWYGLFGGVISLVIVHFSLFFLIAPINELAKLYSSHYVLSGLNIEVTLKILFISSLLGLVGAWLAVGTHLRRNTTAG